MQAEFFNRIGAKADVKYCSNPIAVPSRQEFHIALGLVTVLGAAVTVWIGGGCLTPFKRVVAYGFAAILLANVLIPHLPATLLMGG